MNHDTAAPGTDRIEAQAVGAIEFDPDHDCEFCSPEPVAMPYPGQPAEIATQDPQASAPPTR